MRTMLDSISIPAMLGTPADFYASYYDGNYAQSAAEWASIPLGKAVSITVLGNPQAMVHDAEPGNGSPQTAVVYAQQRLALGYVPTVYCGLHTWYPTIKALMGPALVSETNFWVADYTYNAGTVPPAGTIAIQWTDQGHGGAFDISNVADYWPGVDSAPPGPPQPPEEDDMPWIAASPNQPGLLVSGPYVIPLSGPPQNTSGVAIPTWTLTAQDYQALLAASKKA